MSVSRILAVYRLRSDAASVEARARALALEQSVEMPLEAVRDPRVRAEVVATVESVEPDPSAPGAFLATLGLASETTGPEAGQLMNMLFGNCSLQPDVELLDARLPDEVLAAFPGPRLGIEGWRAATGARGRALTCSALKPQGMTPEQLAALAYALARAGIDVIKDDHGIADQAAAPFAKRVPAVQRAIERANLEKAAAAKGDARLAGHRTIYAPSLSGGPRRLADQIRIAHHEGCGALLACPMLIGLPAFVEVVRETAPVPILAHPAMAGAARIAPPLLLGRLFRLFGADATIFPNFGGRFSYDRDTCHAIAQAAREPLGGCAPILPVPAGGMTVERAGEMIAAFGTDAMLLIGGNLLQAGDALGERAAAFAQRVADESARHAAAWAGCTAGR